MSHERAARRPRTYLNIGFDKKDHAKRHGALWDVGVVARFVRNCTVSAISYGAYLSTRF